jgi:tetratricopeptide (TPR) repeat protein
MNKILWFIIIASISLSFSCEPNTKSNSLEKQETKWSEKPIADMSAKQINKTISKLMRESQYPEKSKKEQDSLLLKALKYCEIAIEKDSSCEYSYLNKANILRYQKNYEKSIDIINTLLEINGSNAEGLFTLGLLQEKTGNLNLAKDYYNKALGAYNKLLIQPESTASDEANKKMLVIFNFGKEKALQMLEKEIKEQPENDNLLIDKKIIHDFNRKDFFDKY